MPSAGFREHKLKASVFAEAFFITATQELKLYFLWFIISANNRKKEKYNA